MAEFDKKIMRAKVKLYLTQPFIGSLMARLTFVLWDEATFATDGKYMFIPADRKVYEAWSQENLVAVIAHEVYHNMLLHPFRLKERQHLRWNLAADFVVNQMLEAEKFKMPPGTLLDHKFAGMHTEKVYQLLSDQMEKMKGQLKGFQMDIRQPGSGSSSKDKDSQESGGENGDGKENAGNKDTNRNIGAEEAAELEARWKELVSYSLQKHQGKIPSGLKEMLDDLYFSKIPWTEKLRRWITSEHAGAEDYRWGPFDRRHVWNGVYLPSMTGDFIELCVAMDTSGSMSSAELASDMGEIRGMCQGFGNYVIHLFQSDAQIAHEQEITEESELPRFVVGRGGTSFVPVFDRIEELQLDHLPLIYFTDTYGDFPKKERPNVMWVTSEGNGARVPFGEVVHKDPPEASKKR